MNPNPEVFAKHVLWRLAAIQADVYQNQLLLIEMLARTTGQEAIEIQKQWKTEADKLRMDCYLESLDAVGIDRDSGPTLGYDRFRS